MASASPVVVHITVDQPYLINHTNEKSFYIEARLENSGIVYMAGRDTSPERSKWLRPGQWMGIELMENEKIWLKVTTVAPQTIEYWYTEEGAIHGK